MHKVKGIPYDPAQDGFDFSKSEIEAFSQRLMRQNQSWHIEYVRFHAPYSAPNPAQPTLNFTDAPPRVHH
jgi:hypothetical protein